MTNGIRVRKVHPMGWTGKAVTCSHLHTGDYISNWVIIAYTNSVVLLGKSRLWKYEIEVSVERTMKCSLGPSNLLVYHNSNFWVLYVFYNKSLVSRSLDFTVYCANYSAFPQCKKSIEEAKTNFHYWHERIIGPSPSSLYREHRHC